jgi:hypothetical protein
MINVQYKNPSMDLDGPRRVRLMERRLKRLQNEVKALHALMDGCDEHPNYRAIRKPKTDCTKCLHLYELNQEYRGE